MTEIKKLIRGALQFFCLVMIDLVAFFLSLFVAWLFRAEVLPLVIPKLPVFQFSYLHFVSLWWIPSLFLFFMFYESLYDSNLPFWDEAKVIVKSISLASITLMGIVTLAKMGGIVSRFPRIPTGHGEG